MVGITELSALISSLKGAKDIAESMVNLRDTAAFQAKAIEFQAMIMKTQTSAIAFQDERASLIETIRSLEKKVADFEAWSAEKERYELKELGNGTLAYCLKDGMQPPEPAHWICASCYGEAKKSILQPEIRFPGRTKVYVCHGCNAELIAEGGREPASHGSLPTQSTTTRPKRWQISN